MNICPSLFHDINFEPTCVQPCCNVHGTTVPQFPFTGGKLDMAAYAAHIEQVFERLQAPDASLCRTCPQLTTLPDREQIDVRMQFKSVSINMHRYHCNCRCVYCDLWKGKGDGYPILPALQSLVEQKVLAPDCYFAWGGGEPSILKEFDETSLWLMKQGWRQYVHTSCLRFSPAIAAILQASQGIVDVSLDSATPQTYQRVKGLDGFDRVRENLVQYVKASVHPENVYLKYIVFELNNSMQEIEKFLELCGQLGVVCVQYSLNFKELNAGGPSAKTLMGAAWFAHRAEQLGLQCSPFSIPPQYQEKIDTLRQENFGK